MLFSEVYNAYFNAVAAILREAVQTEPTDRRMTEIIRQNAFNESILFILPAIKNEEWLLINRQSRTPIKKPPEMPLTSLQKRWLKSLLADPRIALFQPDPSGLEDITPLFSHEDIIYFDQYSDGDPYTDESYIRNFRKILSALRDRHIIKINYLNRRGKNVHGFFTPRKLEYSGKDDKFRLLAVSENRINYINLARVIDCRLQGEYKEDDQAPPKAEFQMSCLTFDLTDVRNALERVMLAFSDCRKETHKLDERHYTVTLWYYPEDETEILIRIFSFGPMISVTSPKEFVERLKERILRQQTLLIKE